MKAAGLLHAELSRIVASLGHGDTVVIADAGLPVPSGVPVVDLAVAPGVPSHLAVLRAVLGELVVERGLANAEQSTVVPEAAAALDAAWPDDVPLERIDHETLKLRSRSARAIVRTGEFTPYANVIVVAGVPF
ncbi:MAG: D-ribose pyranase [Trueperaceae bacterium]|nr:D-ribose pyranase [Trueperaceae bacterium]